MATVRPLVWVHGIVGEMVPDPSRLASLAGFWNPGAATFRDVGSVIGGYGFGCCQFNPSRLESSFVNKSNQENHGAFSWFVPYPRRFS